MTSWRHMVMADLGPFADTSADGPRIAWTEESPLRLSAEWTAHGHDLAAVFDFESTDSPPRVEFSGRTLEYRAFLADANVGGLHRLAERLIAFHRASPYVETLATVDGEDTPQLVARLIAEKIDVPPSDFTNVLFLTGEAGSGKTSALRHLTVQRATDYTTGAASSLFLYINAQGRALATFDQALSVELDDIRSQLTYDMIAPLVRNGLLIPVVDGFDELLGASYDDSFSSLSRFLSTLSGRGRLVACARSAYYEQEFLDRVTKESEGSLSWQVERIEIQAWEATQRRALVDLRCFGEGADRAAEVYAKIESLLNSSDLSSVGGKPFFVDRLVALAREGRQLDSTRSAFDALVTAYIDREVTEKVLDAVGRPLLAASHLRAILKELASEMWLLGSRQLPKDTVREVVAVALEDASLRGQVQEYLHMRGPMLGFLTSSAGGRRVEFEHELIFAYFLGLVFADELRKATQLAWLLPRGVLPPKVAEGAAQELRTPEDITRIVEAICEACRDLDLREDQGRVNAGTLVMAMAAHAKTPPDWHLHDITVGGGSSWSTEFNNARLTRVTFYRADLTRFKFVGCSGTEVSFVDVLVDPNATRLDIGGVDPRANVFGLRLAPSGEEVFVPGEILAVLASCGLVGQHPAPSSTVSDDVVTFMARLARAFSRTNLVWPDDPDKRWTRLPAWEKVRPRLLEAGLLVEEHRENKGQQRAALRGRFEVTELMRGADPDATVAPEVRRFWDAMRRDSPSNSPLQPTAADGRG